MSTKNKKQTELLTSKNKDVKEALSIKSDKALNDFLNSRTIKAQISKVKVKETTITDRKEMFNYSNYHTTMKIDVSKLDKLELKKINKSVRTKVRKIRNSHSNNIILFAKEKRLNELKKEIANFINFYKFAYTLNDFSLVSISRNNRDMETKERLTLMLIIVNQFKMS